MWCVHHREIQREYNDQHQESYVNIAMHCYFPCLRSRFIFAMSLSLVYICIFHSFDSHNAATDNTWYCLWRQWRDKCKLYLLQSQILLFSVKDCIMGQILYPTAVTLKRPKDQGKNISSSLFFVAWWSAWSVLFVMKSVRWRVIYAEREHEKIMEGKIIVQGHSAPILTESYKNKRMKTK